MVATFKDLEPFQRVYRQGSNSNSPSVIKMKTNWLEERRTWATTSQPVDGLTTDDKPSSFLELLISRGKQDRRCFKNVFSYSAGV